MLFDVLHRQINFQRFARSQLTQFLAQMCYLIRMIFGYTRAISYPSCL
jgi:hypothetical protein